MAGIEAGYVGAEMRGSGILALFGPSLMVQVGIDREFIPGAGGTPKLPERRWSALVDTGASLSCINSDLAMQLGLPIVNTGMVSGAHGTTDLKLHLAQIHVPDLGFTLHGQFYGVSLTKAGQPQSVLLGRDFLRHFTMVYDGRTGSVTISDE